MNERQSVSEHALEIKLAKSFMGNVRREVADFNNCNYRRVEQTLESIHDDVKKGKYTLEEVGTSEDEMAQLLERAFSYRERN